jgi:hypothetical protein
MFLPLLLLCTYFFSVVPCANWADDSPHYIEAQETTPLMAKHECKRRRCCRGCRGHRGPRGDRGPHGHRGRAGMPGSTSLASFYSTTVQSVGTNFPIALESMNFTPIVGKIAQSPDFTTITIADPGLYQISYGVSSFCDDITVFGLTLDGTPVPGSLISQDQVQSNEMLSGVVIIAVTPGQIIQLVNLSISELTVQPGGTQVDVVAYLSIDKLNG